MVRDVSKSGLKYHHAFHRNLTEYESLPMCSYLLLKVHREEMFFTFHMLSMGLTFPLSYDTHLKKNKQQHKELSVHLKWVLFCFVLYL